MKLPKREYTTEFREQAVARIAGGRGIAANARELGMFEQALRNWVKEAKTGKLAGAGNKAITPEQMELSHLRAESTCLKCEMELIKKAAAYFASDVL
jgi:transposase